MKNKFFTGLLAGIASSLLISTLILILAVKGGVFWNQSYQNENVQTEAAKTANSAKDSSSGLSEASGATNALIDSASFNKKKAYIKTLIEKYYMGEVTEEQYQIAELRSILEALEDPYSCYYTKEEYDAMMESSSGTYCGIGALVNQNAETGIITIVKPFVDGPAYKAGILPGDILYKVNGEEVTGKDLTQVVSELKGKAKTKVSIEMVREGESDPLKFDVTRAAIEVPTVEYEMLPNNIGYISVMEFDEVTEAQFRDAIKRLEKDGMKGLVVDLRGNPGGLLHIVCGMLDRMLPEGLIVYTEDKGGNREEKKSTAKEEFTLPLAVLINGNSASASEIFAGAIQDYGIGTIVGTKSFGKGIVQSVFPLYDGSAIKVTISSYFTPKGRNIHKTGITPDVEVKLDEGLSKMVTIPKEKDNQLQKALEVIKGKIK